MISTETAKCSCGSWPYYPAKVRAKVGDFERVITFRPGFKCELTGGSSHGQHGMDLLFLLIGDKGAIQFVVYTMWMIDPDFCRYSSANKIMPPMAADIGYHSPKPMYEGQASMGNDCPWIDGECFYDGSSLQAEEVFKVFRASGEEALWELLEERYRDWFESKD
jgi:hypothetical protein